MSAAKAKALGLSVLAKISAYANAGVDPAIMGIAPVSASRHCLDKAGWSLNELDLIEANEAFAVQALAVGQELGWDAAKVNVNGGAIALGPDRRLRLPRAGQPAARDDPPRCQERPGDAVHRRRPGRGAGH